MAAALFNMLADPAKATATSAGSNPGDAIYPVTITLMKEVGVDLTGIKPQKLTEELVKGVNVVVTMGCGEACPFVPGVETVAWTIPDPHGAELEDARVIRELLQTEVAKLITERGWGR